MLSATIVNTGYKSISKYTGVLEKKEPFIFLW